MTSQELIGSSEKWSLSLLPCDTTLMPFWCPHRPSPGNVWGVARPESSLATAMATLPAAGLDADDDVLRDQARGFVRDARAASTLRAYRSDWADFLTWCDARGSQSLPAEAETVALYLTHLATARARAVATIQRRLTAIAEYHRFSGYPTPTRDERVRLVLGGIRRRLGTAQHAKAPAVTEDVLAMLRGLPLSAAEVPAFTYRRGATLAQARPRVQVLLGLRDRALLLLGFAGAFRRSELVGLDVADVRFVRDGMVVSLRRSKTDQEGAGEQKAIAYGERPESCPVRALQAWLEAAAIASGPLFRRVTCWGRAGEQQLSAQVVALVVKQRALAAGLDPHAYAGHSLRAGLATAAARAGVEERDIMRQTGHRSERMVRKYIREGQLFRNNASSRVGL